MLRNLELRETVSADFLQSGLVVTWPFTGLTATIDGAIAGFAGVHRFGVHHWVYFNVFDERVKQPFFLHRLVRDVLASYDRAGFGNVYSICDHETPSARRWHGALGFREVVDAERDQEILACEAHCNRGAWVR